MDWDHLRFFVAVARAGNLGGAARNLNVNHTTVFRRIKAFETDLGVRLFDRLPEGYSLTAAGEQVLEHGARVDESIAALLRAVAGKDYQLSGEIRITTAPNLATRFVAPALKKFRKRFPGIRVEIAVSDSDFDLRRREADLALRATSSPPDYLVGRRVVQLPWFFYGSKRNRRQAPPSSLADLTGNALIGGDENLQRLPPFAWLHNAVPKEQFVATANDLNTVAAMIASGLGIGVLPSDQDRPGIERLFQLDARFSSDIWLLTHPDLRQVARVRTFSQFLFDELREDSLLGQFVQ